MSNWFDTQYIQYLISALGSQLSSNQQYLLNAITGIYGQFEGLGEDIDADVAGQIGEALEQAFDDEGSATATINNALSSLVATTETDVSGVVNAMEGLLGDLIKEQDDEASAILQGVVNGIQNESSGAINVLRNIGEGILDEIGITTDGAVGSVADTAVSILQLIGVDTSEAIDAITRVADQVGETTSQIMNIVGDEVTAAFEGIDNAVAEQTQAAVETLEVMSNQTLQQSEQQLEASEEQAEAIREGIAASIDTLTDTSDSALATVAESTDAQTAATVKQTEAIEAGFMSLGMAGQGIDAIAGWLMGGDQDTDAVQDRSAMYQRMVEGFRSAGIPEDDAIELADQITGMWGSESNIILYIMSVVASAMLQMTFLREIGNVLVTPKLQEIAALVPSAIPDIGTLLELRRRGLIDDSIAVTLMRRLGFTEAMAEGMLASRSTIPEVGIVQSWYLREFISADVARSQFERLGYVQEDAERLLNMSFFIPPPQDIILWAVREVFNREQAERFGQFDEFPNEFADLASKQGISRDFAQNYWAAHWRMPSLTRLFEMFHRKIIDEETLRLTIKSHDYTPFWREPLIDVAYKPLTRVDVRRMHDLGLLTDEQLQDRYEDLGFSPADAAMMKQFTIEYNSEPAAESPEVIEAVAREPIIALYKDGTLLFEEASEMLINLGMPEAEAGVFLSSADLERERDERQQQKKLIVEQARVGAMTQAEAFDALHTLGFEPEEVQRASVEIHRARVAATKLPTREELDDMLARELISEADYIAALQRLGYSPFWAQRFLALKTVQ